MKFGESVVGRRSPVASYCGWRRVCCVFFLLLLATNVCAQDDDDEYAADPPTAAPTAPTSAPNSQAEIKVVPAAPAAKPASAKGNAAVPLGQGEDEASATDEGGESTGKGAAEEQVFLNVKDAEILDIVKQISKATGRNFIIDERALSGKKLTILSERSMTKGEAYQTFLSALNVAGFTIVEGPGGVLKIVRLQDAKSNPIPTHVDTIPITDLYITRLITLKNVGAADMMGAIRPMLSATGTMSVYAQTNTLIITDSGANIDRLMKIVKELDTEGPQQVMEIIHIANAAAKDVAGMVNQLFDEQKKSKSAPKAGEAVDIDEVSKLIPDERTNSIIVLASKRAMDQVRDVIHRLDQKISTGQEGRIHVYYLKHADAKKLATTLQSLTQDAGKAAPKTTGAPGAAPASVLAEFEGGLKITADETINALVITATYKDYQTLVERVLSKLDVQRRQVYLEAVIMELRMSNGKEYGASAHGGIGMAGQALGFGQTFGAIQGLQRQLAAGPAILGGLISQRTVNINTVNAQGQAQSVSIPAFSAFLDALSTYTDANVVSSPNLLTLDNEKATIEVQQEIPIPGQQTLGSAGLASIAPVTYEKAGLTMNITPHIGQADQVNLEIDQELSTFGERDPVLNAPTKVKRHVKTNVICEDGSTIVIGGLMQDEINNSKNKVPVLGDIPLLGFFFSQTTKNVDKSNLLIFITPHVVSNTTDFGEILKRKIEERNRYIQDNYGKKQQEVIKASIRSHREDLLQFKEESAGAPASVDKAHHAPLPPYPHEALTSAPTVDSVYAAPTTPVITAPAVTATRSAMPIINVAPSELPSTAPNKSATKKSAAPVSATPAPVISAPSLSSASTASVPTPAWVAKSVSKAAASSTSQPIIEQTIVPAVSAKTASSAAAPASATVTTPAPEEKIIAPAARKKQPLPSEY